MKQLILVMLVFVFCGNMAAQEPPQPQYYNYENVGASDNNFPFNWPTGRAVQWLFYAGDFNQPEPLPEGQQITNIYYWIVATSGTPTYTDFVVLMASDTITYIPHNTLYSGPMDTVFYRPEFTLPATEGAWMSITLDEPFVYDPEKSLIVMVGQCGHGELFNGHTIKQVALNPNRRAFSAGGCPFTPWHTVAETVANFGVDVEPDPTVGVENVSTPIEFKLYDNYPNPFNPATTIKYYLAERTHVTLQIFDNVGRLVATLQNGYQEAGVHEKTFDGKNLTGGIYNYKLSAGNNVETRKMTLVK